jgi:hypothetical protein
MKNRLCNTLIIICLLLFSVSCANRKSPAKGDLKVINPAEKKTPGKIAFDKEIHNFGTLKDGEIVSFSFVFRNIGGSAVNITNADKSCGCIDIKYDANMISPGESSAVEVVFNTAGEWGNQLKGVTLKTSTGEQKELQIGAYIENKQFNNLLNTQK